MGDEVGDFGCRLQRAQEHLRATGADAWLIYDFRGNNAVWRLLLPDAPTGTRRVFLCIPAHGEPSMLVHEIEKTQFESMPFELECYSDRRALVQRLQRRCECLRTVAMEYSPMAQLPTASIVDAGTFELVESTGVDVVSSAELIQICLASWDEATLASHHRAAAAVDQTRRDAFDFLRGELAGGRSSTEIDVQRFILERFADYGVETDHGPVVGVNAHSGDPHYTPDASSSLPIGRGDWVLIDLWARLPDPGSVFADSTWVAYAGEQCPEHYGRVFDIVKGARDLVIQRCQHGGVAEAVGKEPATKAPCGWELDRLARDYIAAAGFGSEHFPHRTGHSLSPGDHVHGIGVNLDDLESKDTRRLVPGCGFTVEPGVYLSEFGVRLEVDVFVDPHHGPLVTTEVQDEVVLLC